MKTAQDLYNEAIDEVVSSGSQSLNVVALVVIDKARKELFYYLYKEAENENNKYLNVLEFFDKIEKNIDL
jgi:hypothetical protein